MASDDSLDRRDFLKKASVASLGALAATRRGALSSISPATGPLLVLNGSPAEKMVVGVMGLNGRGMVHAAGFARGPNTTLGYLCDVDSKVLAKALNDVSTLQSPAPKTVGDFRRMLDDKSVDAVAIATPDHWHVPATILALDAGKHVYVEKPSGHDPREDELIVEAARKHPHLKVQLGTQARSGPHFIEALQLVREGQIGTPYLARAWYANTRTGIGKGKVVPVPPNLDYEMWQGPAPRTPYRDNVIHYNWHWFTNWGTGEICNNGTHEIDVARWFLGVDYPTSVTSTGGRFHYDDDWQFPDTQEATFVFDGNKSIIWQGQSCNGLLLYERSRGTAVLGTKGSVIVDRDGYVVYDLNNKIVKQLQAAPKGDALNTVGDDWLTKIHQDNFTSAVRTGTKLSAPIEDGAKTGTLCHLGTIAQQLGRKLTTSRSNGHIIGDAEASARWSRQYDPRWKPVV
ncbi:MAG TPA: Gfo/Idh/MocA family oxidoreductase [Gemmatimonadaceae bacterium]|nr:Gfo/Idh/MocA family oxidoreductase [Gemmatimonadaceae bacterium]